jgi:hypothetical protein
VEHFGNHVADAAEFAMSVISSTAIRKKQNPILPDFEEGRDSDVVSPHPDGRAWLKACAECALRTSDPQNLGERYQRRIAAGSPETFFYCIHRTDGGKHRICGCYAALHSC